MTDKILFEFADYKSYLFARLSEGGARSGLRSQLAKALGCQNSFISQVLNTGVDLSLEQAYAANDFLSHDSHQAHFFMLLVQKERAGSRKLKDYYQDQIEYILSERRKIKSRLTTTHELSEGQQARYYSQWDISAIHMAMAVPGLRSVKDLGQALHLPLKRVEEVLEFLIKSGLAQFDGSEYRVGQLHMHLGTDSPFLRQHHTNWRVEALRRLNTQNSEQLHYSGTFSLSNKDYLRLRENLLRVIQENLAVVRPSPEEMVVCQMIDLIPLSGGGPRS